MEIRAKRHEDRFVLFSCTYIIRTERIVLILLFSALCISAEQIEVMCFFSQNELDCLLNEFIKQINNVGCSAGG